MTGRRLAGRVAGVVVLVAVLVAGSSIAAPAPRAAAAAPTAAPPVPEGLWDTPVAVPAGKTYALVEPVPGGPAAAVPAATYTRSDSVITVSDGVYAYGIGVAALDYGTGFNVKRRSGTAPLIDMGFHSDLDAVWLGTPFDCADPNGWLAVDSVATDPDGGITSFEYRFEMSCGTTVAVHMKGRVVGADTATPPGPEPVPAGLWDAAPPVAPGQSYVLLDAEPGETLVGSTQLFTRADAQFDVFTNGRALAVDLEGETELQSRFNAMSYLEDIKPGYYGNARWPNFALPLRGSFSVGYEHLSCEGEGWFAIDDLQRVNGLVTSLRLRAEYRCNGGPALHIKVVWSTADRTGPPGPSPIPADLWDTQPAGTDASTSYVAIDSVDGDPVTNGRDYLFTGPANPFVLRDYGNGTQLIVSNSSGWTGFFQPPYNLNGLQPGYYANADTSYFGNPTRPRLEWTDGTTVCHEVTGWMAVDRIERVAGAITALILRFEQSCDGGPAIRGKVHIVPPGQPGVPLPKGPPFGSLDVVLGSVGQISISGWAIDPDTSVSIPVHVYVDGVGRAVTAAGERGDVGRAYPGYGTAHGFTLVADVPGGRHTVCAYGINTGVGTNTLLGCKEVAVPSGSPFGSLDLVRPTPGQVYVAGWAIDPDTRNSSDVHVYVDGKGVAISASGARPDVASAYPMYGPTHGFTGAISASPGRHTVCAYGINTGVGANSLLGCRDIIVPSGPPFGSLDVVIPSPGQVYVAGWAIDPDTASPIDVHVYVDTKGVALRATGSRPDVSSAYAGYGPAHGFTGTISVAPGQHTVCAYGINTGLGSNSLLGCRQVTTR